MTDTPEIAGAKRRLEDQATSVRVPNWARQLLNYISRLERELAYAISKDHDAIEADRAVERGLALLTFKDAWEVYQGDFLQAADFDKEHGGAYIIKHDDYERIRRKVNAVIGEAMKQPLAGRDG